MASLALLLALRVCILVAKKNGGVAKSMVLSLSPELILVR